VYEGLETLTGAATADERRRLDHRLLSFVPVTREFSVGEFMPLAHAEIDGALAEGRRPIVVGGTGLYLRAALTDLSLKPPPAPGVRERVEHDLATLGPARLHEQLRELAPRTAATIEPGDRSRIVRALELAEMGELDDDQSEESELWTSDTRRPTLLAGLVMRREALYSAIDRRVEAMVEAGAAEEVRAAHAAGASRTARAALGFQELLEGDIDAMKRRTRNYAKRQLTWMRKLSGVQVIDATGRDAHDVATEIAEKS